MRADIDDGALEQAKVEAERARIVAWLRAGGRGATVDNVHTLADAIEKERALRTSRAAEVES
jgi:hypothetical protein